MFGRITRIKGSPETQQQGVDRFDELVAGPARALPGFQGISLLVNRDTGEGMSITYWADRDSLDNSAIEAAKIREKTTSTLGSEVTSVESGEIVDIERAGPPEANTFVRMNTVKGAPDRVEAAIAAYKANVLPVLKQQKGFRAAITAADRERGTLWVSSVWDSEASRSASDAALTKLRRETGQTAGAADVKVELFEVAYIDMSAAGPGAR